MLLSIITGCARQGGPSELDLLYEGFNNPPAESRPFVRWWWNGNKIESNEINRELELLKEVGFGGVEINPIAFPSFARETGVESKVWMSEEWIELLVQACRKAGELDMIAAIVTMFYIAAYGFINIAFALEKWASTDFRPSFKISQWVGILGFIACFAVMFKLDTLAMLGAMVILA